MEKLGHRPELDVLRVAGSGSWLRVATGLALLHVLWSERPWTYGSTSVPRNLAGGWVLDALPSSTLALAVGSGLLVVAAVALIGGWSPRWAAIAAAVLGFWILGVPQGFGGVSHYHHVLFAAVALAAASTVAGAAAFTRLFVGVAYFFPGLAKLQMGGAWLSGDALRAHVEEAHQSKDVLVEWMPPAPLLAVMAVAVVVFELGFVAAVMTRWWRVAVVVAVAFHLGTGALMGVWFVSMILIVASLAAEDGELLRLPRRTAELVPVSILVCALMFGAARVEWAWPAAHYPAFDWVPSSEEIGGRLWAVASDGDCRSVGSVLLPDAPAVRQWKVERGRSLDDLRELVTEEWRPDVELAVGTSCDQIP